MKKTVQELATGDTTTSTTGISALQGKVWLKEVIKAAKRRMFFAQFAYETVAGPGVKDVAVPIALTNVTFTENTTEGAARTATQIDDLNTVTFTPATKKFAAYISKDVVRTSQVDVVKFARDQISYQASYTVEAAVVTALDAATPLANLYGGDATNTGSLATGDVLTPDLLAKGLRYLKAESWFAEPDKPFVLVIPAVCEEAFMKDSQFVNASEYGGNEVVMNGEIGRYLGCKIVVSEFCTSASDWGSGSLAGHVCYLFRAKTAYGICWGEKPTLDYEYEKDQAEHRIYLDMCFQVKALMCAAAAGGGSLVLIRVSDA